MKDSTQNRKKKYLALFLSAMMALSVASLAACKKGGNASSSDSSSEEETTTETTVIDKGLIKNAGFETFNTNDGLNVIGTSVSSWTKSLYSDGTNSAPSSKAASGIVDTEADAWYNMTGSYYVNNGDAETIAAADELINALSEADAISLWDNFTVRDKLTYYEAWEDANEDGKIEEDFEKYENFNVDLIDLPDAENPGTHHSADETSAEGFSDYNVLMIHNKNPESDEGDKVVQSIGSAQYYKSSSTVTVPAGGAAEISVWVKTQGLTCSSSDGPAQEAVDKGAYINLAQTVGGTTMPVYEVKNVNTEYMGLEDTNGWKQYTFYVKGSSYASTTLTLTLGLGQGPSQNRFELVNGYAFFDDITCHLFSQEDFYKTADNANGKVDVALDNVADPADFAAPKALKTIDVSKAYDDNAYANAENCGYVAGDRLDVFPIDFYGAFTDADSVLDNLNTYATKSENGYTSMTGNNTMPTLEGGREGSADTIAVFDNLSAIKNYNGDADKKQFIDGICEKYLSDVEYPGDNNKVLLMLSARGVAYTAKSNYTFSFSSDVEYLAVSFFVRTSDMSGFTGAGVTLIDGSNKTSISNIDTTNISPVNIGVEGTDDYREDIYEGWQQCIFFVKNDSDDVNASFTLQFNFGPTTINESSTLSSFQPGFAAFTNFQTLVMSEEEYESATAGTYAKIVTVTGEEDVTAAGNSGFDTAGNKSTYHTDIKNGIALAQNYKGVYSNSDYVTDNFTPNGNGTASNTYVNAGLLNRTYFAGLKGEESYYTTTDAPAWMAGVTAIAQANNSGVNVNDAAAVWSAAFGDATQPLFIWNDGSDTENAYGFIGSSTTIAANTTTAISMRVKVGSTNANAAAPTAHIYLIDTGDDARTNILSIGANRTYWYDKNGNVCTGDSSEHTSEKAFLLQDNGLYIANKTWDGYTAEMDGKYYANLSAYTETDANGNKLVSAQGGIHGYVTAADYVKVNGVKRAVAFYCQDGTYYADKAHKIPVADFSESGLAPRTGVTESKALHATVSATDDWVTVTFYVKTGAAAKNYRLEVWSGERTGNPNAAGTYVMFDGNPSASSNASTYYDYMLEEYEDDENVEQYKSVFSYFDTDNFLRYNKELDEDKVGNLYKDNYDATAQEETTFYLYAGATDENQIFLVNYGVQDQVVTASEADSDGGTTDDDHDHTEETDNAADPFLLASSIALAAVLLFAIVSIIFRKVWKKARKNAVSKKRTSKQSKKQPVVTVEKTEKPKEEIDEDSPYND